KSQRFDPKQLGQRAKAPRDQESGLDPRALQHSVEGDQRDEVRRAAARTGDEQHLLDLFHRQLDKWAATRRAFAAMVRLGLMPPPLGKNEASTMYKLSR